METLIIGAYGKVAQRVIREAVDRGFQVTGVAPRLHDDTNLATDQIVAQMRRR